jgi:hypothetical protein
MRRLAFWLKADQGVQTDEARQIVAWQDLAIGDNRTAEDAFQPAAAARPLLVSDAMNGRPAVRFDGRRTYLSTTPMATGDDQTIVAVFQNRPTEARPKRARHAGGQIINYNGPPSRFLANTYQPGVLQMGENVGAARKPASTTISAKAYSGRAGGDHVDSGLLTSAPLGYGQPAVVVYVYDNAQNRSSLVVNGVRQGDSTAPRPVAINSRKIIGKHGFFDRMYFSGDLAQLLIYNAALASDEVAALSRALMRDYGIAATVN